MRHFFLIFASLVLVTATGCEHGESRLKGNEQKNQDGDPNIFAKLEGDWASDCRRSEPSSDIGSERMELLFKTGGLVVSHLVFEDEECAIPLEGRASVCEAKLSNPTNVQVKVRNIDPNNQSINFDDLNGHKVDFSSATAVQVGTSGEEVCKALIPSGSGVYVVRENYLLMAPYADGNVTLLDDLIRYWKRQGE